MGKRYASVSEVVSEFIDDESFRERFEKEISDKRVAKTLFAIRSRAGKTQGEMAERLGCSQGTISKLENSGVDGIKVSDLVAYAQACDLNLTIGFHEEQSAVESVKAHVFAIKDHLDHLAELAQGDKDIFDGVRAFYGEYLTNVLHLFEKSARKLLKHEPHKGSVLQVTTPPVESSKTADRRKKIKQT
jgi:transcriptional regulator with XRE-family HTH domain